MADRPPDDPTTEAIDVKKLTISFSVPHCSERWKTNSLPRFVCIKIAALDTDASGELEQSKLIAKAKPSHEGLAFLRTPLDAFPIRGPNGTHSCLVFKPMRETLHQFQQRLRRQRLPLPLFKLFMYCLLQGLDYLHTECDLIHTGMILL